jgi:hypothetical protein
MTLQELIEQYGEDNAEYLYETLCRGTKNYERFAYIPMGVEPESINQAAHEQAAEKKWDIETVSGDMRLINMLVNGDWDEEEFLKVPPGYTIKNCYDDSIVTCAK